jgi:hypothetical protein
MPRVEIRKSKIDRIGTVGDRRAQRLVISGRREELGAFHNCVTRVQNLPLSHFCGERPA